MPNKSSNAGHVPMRTCIVCRQKKEKKYLLRFVIINKETVIDVSRKIPSRGLYLCDENECIGKSEKWLRKRISRKKM